MHRRESTKVYFVNANSVVIAKQNAYFRAALSKADMVLADGSGVRWGSALLKAPLVYNLNGTDLIPELCREGLKQVFRCIFWEANRV